jgi:hypothetical protein
LLDQLLDASLDLVADWPHLLERQIFWIGEIPTDSGHARRDRADLVATGGNGELGPVERFSVEFPRHVIGRVDPDLPQCLDDLRVWRRAWVAAG